MSEIFRKVRLKKAMRKALMSLRLKRKVPSGYRVPEEVLTLGSVSKNFLRISTSVISMVTTVPMM